MNEQKLEIFQASCEAFSKYGIKRVTMDDIAKSMGMSKKTLYNFFSGKTELIEETLEHFIKNPHFSFDSKKLENLNAIERYIKFYLFIEERIKDYHFCFEYDLKKYYPKMWEPFMEKRQAIFVKELEGNIKQGVSEGLFRDDINIDFIVQLLKMFFFHIWQKEFQDLGKLSFTNEDINRELTFYHLRGICSNKGLEYLETLNFREE